MITPRKLIILVAALVILGGVSFLQKSQHSKEVNSSSTAILLKGDFGMDNVRRIILGKGANTEAVVLKADDNNWVIESHFNAEAQGTRISTLVRSFSNLAGEFRSDNEKVIAQYGLSDDEAIKVRGYDESGAEILALDIGNTPMGFSGQFMRIPGSSKVYLSQQPLLANMGIYGEATLPKYQFFLHLQAVQESNPNLDGMTLRDGNTTLAFTKKFSVIEPAEGAEADTTGTVDRNTWEWLLEGKAATDLAKTKIDAVLNACSSIRATDVADPTVSLADYGLDSPVRSLKLIRNLGQDVELEFGNTREAGENVTAGTYMRVVGKPTVWVVTSYTMKNIFKNLDDLKAE